MYVCMYVRMYVGYVCMYVCMYVCKSLLLIWRHITVCHNIHALLRGLFNLSAPELFFFILAHPVYKIWIIQEPNTLDHETNCILKREKKESLYRV
jgi:hypothetical protein